MWTTAGTRCRGSRSTRSVCGSSWWPRPRRRRRPTGLYAPGLPFHLDTTLDAFRAAGAAVASREDLAARGVYLTTAVKCAKVGYAVERPTVEACSRLLEAEIGLFPKARVIMLMGDVAIGAVQLHRPAAHREEAHPVGPHLEGAGRASTGSRGSGSSPPTSRPGKSYLIERSKREMIAADLKAALALLEG